MTLHPLNLEEWSALVHPASLPLPVNVFQNCSCSPSILLPKKDVHARLPSILLSVQAFYCQIWQEQQLPEATLLFCHPNSTGDGSSILSGGKTVCMFACQNLLLVTSPMHVQYVALRFSKAIISPGSLPVDVSLNPGILAVPHP